MFNKILNIPLCLSLIQFCKIEFVFIKCLLRGCLDGSRYIDQAMYVRTKALFCKQQDMETMNYTKCSYEGLNFACNNLTDACSVEISEAKSSNILSMPKDTGSEFGLPLQIDFITSECRYTIL